MPRRHQHVSVRAHRRDLRWQWETVLHQRLLFHRNGLQIDVSDGRRDEQIRQFEGDVREQRSFTLWT